MKQRDIVIALLILLLLLVIFRRSKLTEYVESKILYYGKTGEKPPWQGKIGDVVEWGGKTWAWTESPLYGNDWFEIQGT